MSQLAEQLHQVIEKTERLLGLCATLQEKNNLLKLENQSLKVAVDADKNKSADLEERIRIMNMARSLEGLKQPEFGFSEKSLDIKQKISEFVREIDKCIVLLKK